jgi:hypothetical protein
VWKIGSEILKLSVKLHSRLLSLHWRERIEVRVESPRLTLTPTLSLKGRGRIRRVSADETLRRMDRRHLKIRCC